MIITGYSSRNKKTVPVLVELANTINRIRVLDIAGSNIYFPIDYLV